MCTFITCLYVSVSFCNIGEIKEKIHISLTTNDKKDYTTLTEQAEAPIQISKEFVTVMEYGCKDNFRPELGSCPYAYVPLYQ